MISYAEKLDDLLVTDLKTPFDLFTKPPVRFEYVIGPNGQAELVFTIHHIIYDGWSNDIFLKELSASYSGHQLPEIHGKWADFAQISRRMALKDTAGYWMPEFTEQVSTTPLDWARIPQTGKSHSRIPGEIYLDSIQESELLQLAQSMETTLSTLIQSAWGLALIATGPHTRITFGSVYSGRYGHSVDVEHHIGLFISTIPFVMKLDMDQSPSELLESVHHSMVSHQDYPFAHLPEMASELGVQELFDSILVIENYPLNAEAYSFVQSDGTHVSIKSYRFHSEESVPLTVSVNYSPEFHIEIRFDAARFHSSAVKKVADTFEFMLKNLANAEFGTIGDLIDTWKKNQADKLKSKSLKKLTALKNK
jgi:hypothetical protein